MADWTEEELQAADRAAVNVGNKVLDEEFWPPAADVNPPYFKEFAAICQDGVFDREVLV